MGACSGKPGEQKELSGKRRTVSTTPSTSSFDYFLDETHEALRSTVEDFAHRVVAPRAAAIDEAGEFPYDLVSGMAAMGLFGLPFPESYGGMGGDYFALCLAIEELARVDSSVAITLEAGVSLGAMPVFRFGNDAQRKVWLPRLTGGATLAAFGLTEPDGGTDAGATRTRAALDDGAWPIDAFQAIQFKIADMAVRTHTARLAYHDAAARMLAGKPFKKQAAMAKLYASEIAVTNAREATQIHGGYGFMNEAPVARFWRDSKILEIGEGTSEVQRMLIARELGLPGT